MPKHILSWTTHSALQLLVADSYEECERNRKNLARRKGYDADSYRCNGIEDAAAAQPLHVLKVQVCIFRRSGFPADN